jgi:subtilisin family serine protease
MRSRWLGGLPIVLGAACSDYGAPAGEPVPAESAPSVSSVTTVQDGLTSAFNAPDDTVPVIVNFRDPSVAPASGAVPSAIEARRVAIRALGDQVLADERVGFTVSRRYVHVPAVAGRITRDALDRLSRNPSVSYIQRDGRGRGQLKVAVPAIGGDKVKSMYGLTGKGITAAVLDTGVDTTHPDLKDSIVAQHCFTQFDCPPTHSAEGTSAEDDHGHGSNVTGIITSNGVVAGPGFAPDTAIVAVKVNDSNDSGQESDWVSGFDWVFENLSTLKVKIVNFSAGTDALYASASDCDSKEPALAQAIKNLVGAGVTVFVAAGNEGSSTEMSAPACNTGAIAVGATYDSVVAHEPPGYATYSARWGAEFATCGDDSTVFDQITCFTNTSAQLTLVAPGAPVVSDSLNGMTEAYYGTSQATPVAAGVAALMLQCNGALTPAEIKTAMVDTGVPDVDKKTGRTFPSLRALDVVRSVCFADGGAPAGDGGGAADSSAEDGAVAMTLEAGSAPPPEVEAGGLTSGSSSGAAPNAAGGADASDNANAASPSDGPATAFNTSAGCSCRIGSSNDRTRAASSIAGLALAIGCWSRRRRART